MTSCRFGYYTKSWRIRKTAGARGDPQNPICGAARSETGTFLCLLFEDMWAKKGDGCLPSLEHLKREGTFVYVKGEKIPYLLSGPLSLI